MEHLGGVFTDRIEHTNVLHKFSLDARIKLLVNKKAVADK